MGFGRSPQGYPVGRQPRKGTHFVSGSSRPWSRVLRGVTVQVYFRKPGARPGFMCVNFGGFFLANKTRRIWFHRVGPFFGYPRTWDDPAWCFAGFFVCREGMCFPTDEHPSLTGNDLPADYLFWNADKDDGMLQILFHKKRRRGSGTDR